MGLAHMMALDKTALICDLAETYQIYSMEQLPARVIATLACGLKADSRIQTKMAGVKISPPFVLLGALIVDELRALRYAMVGDKKHEPVFVTDIMAEGIPVKDTVSFESGAEFEQARQKIIEGLK